MGFLRKDSDNKLAIFFCLKCCRNDHIGSWREPKSHSAFSQVGVAFCLSNWLVVAEKIGVKWPRSVVWISDRVDYKAWTKIKLVRLAHSKNFEILVISLFFLPMHKFPNPSSLRALLPFCINETTTVQSLLLSGKILKLLLNILLKKANLWIE